MAPTQNKFSFTAPVRVYEDASKSDGQRRRIAGIISTDSIDRQGEAILQDGMDFKSFIKNGWFNDNHSSKMSDVLGWPESVKHFAKGEQLPDGSVASANCTWAEGYLSNRANADAVWELAKDLEGTGRSLGFSIEGKIVDREGPGQRVVSKAEIAHCAITHVPVNTDSRLMTLVRSMQAAEEQANKAMGIDLPGCGPGKLTAQPGEKYGSGQAMRILARESLSPRITNLADGDDYAEARKKARKQAVSAKKSHSRADFLKCVFEQFPNASVDFALMLADQALCKKG